MEQLFQRLVKAQRDKMLAEAVLRLKNSTPVKTGRARNGWQVTKEGIRNAVPYISFLNSNGSLSTARHFVEMAILRDNRMQPNGTIVKHTR